MSTRATIAHDETYHLYEEMLEDKVFLDAYKSEFTAWRHGCQIELPPAVIDAIRAAPKEAFPHLRTRAK
jgi:hypothetical protein